MAEHFYATVVGAKQGTFKGEGTTPMSKGKIPGVDFVYGVDIPHDPSGHPAGRHQHLPVVFTKEWGASSPQFYAAAFTNENLTSVLFEFIATAPDGKEFVDHTIKLTNAFITEVEQSINNGQPGGPIIDSRDLQSISFTFQKIEIVSLSGGTQATDDWQITT
jgi:type VI secretion system secreted protein Hcp